MDPLSVIASCIAVVGASRTAVRGLKKLTALHNAPNVLLAVMNEIADLSLIVQEIKLTFQVHKNTLTTFQPTFSPTTVTRLLDRAQGILLDLDKIVNYRLLVEIKDNGEGKMIINRLAWLQEENHVCRLQERLRVVRLDIVAGLAALSFSNSLRLEVRLQELHLMTENIRNSQNFLGAHQRERFAEQRHAVEEIFTQMRYIQENQSRSDEELRTLDHNIATSRALASSIEGRHQSRASNPDLIQHSSSLSSTCPNSYQTKRDGPDVYIRVVAIRPGNSMIFAYAELGDKKGIQRLFQLGEASPFDVSVYNNDCVLKVAVQNRQHDTCKFLLDQGADPNFSIGNSSHSAAEQAWRLILMKRVDETTVSTFRAMFDDHDYSERQEFTALHNMVLGIDKRNVKHYLQMCSKSEIDRVDKSGQTALHWAAARADLGATQSLLEMHADPEILHEFGYGALHCAVRAGSLAVMKSLLNAGAKVDLCRHPFLITPLIFTFCSSGSIEEPNIECIELLIDAGADINAQDGQGATPLIFASQLRYSVSLKFLLDRQADINIQTFDGETALCVAIQMNSHASLQILLDYGADHVLHSKRGRSILHEAADYGDLKTLKTLISARIRGLKIDEKDSGGNTPLKVSRKREESSEWHEVFADLLASVDERAPDNITSTSTIHNDIHQSYATTAVGAAQFALIQLYADLRQIYEYMGRLPRPPVAVLRALLLVLVAIMWWRLL